MEKLNLSREQIVTEFAKIQYQNYLSHLPFDMDSTFDDCNSLFGVYLKFLNQANALSSPCSRIFLRFTINLSCIEFGFNRYFSSDGISSLFAISR